MHEHFIHDPIQLLTGIPHRTHPMYVEATQDVEGRDERQTRKMLNRLLRSIQRANSKDPAISASKGNITTMSDYETLKKALDKLKSTGISLVSDLVKIHSSLLSNQGHYIDAYRKRNSLLVLEYESTVSILLTGVTFVIVNHIDVDDKTGKINVKKSATGSRGVIAKIITDLAKQVSKPEHSKYLSTMIGELNFNESEEYFDESIKEKAGIIGTIMADIGSLWNTLSNAWTKGTNAWRVLKRTAFGILPLIRSIMYLRYRGKAKRAQALDVQAQYVELNVSHLQNMKNMDEKQKAEIIKKQQAYVTAFRKKAEKIRAELSEDEKAAASAISSDNKVVVDDKSDDDLTLD